MFYFLRIKQYLFNTKKALIINIIAALLANICLLTAPLFLGLAINQFGKTLSPVLGQMNIIGVYLLVALILYGVGAIFTYIAYSYSVVFGTKIASNIKNKLEEEMINSSLLTFEKKSSGEMIHIISSQIDQIREALSKFFTYFIPGVVTVVSSLVIIFVINWAFVIPILIMVPLLFIYSNISSRISKKSFSLYQKHNQHLSAVASDVFTNMPIITGYGYQDEVKAKFAKEQKLLLKQSKTSYFIASINNPSFRLIHYATYMLMGLTLIILNKQNISIPTGSFSTILVYSAMFFRPFNDISNFNSNFMLGSASLKNVEKLFAMLSKEKREGQELNKKITGDISFNNVFFSFDKSKELIKDFNLKVPAKSKVAIVGHTGAGKTTLVNLLLEFYQVDKGTITFDGINKSEISLKSVRNQFGLVLQDPWLFEGTIRENLTYAMDEYDEEKMLNVAKEVHIDEFVSKLSNGYDTIINESSNLSLGQKQLITIARAILKDSPIMILDEATSHIDSLMEVYINDAFNKAMKNKTSFVIAHRLRTIEDADIILVIDKGSIVESGNHEMLMNQKSYYFNLYNSQYAKEKQNV